MYTITPMVVALGPQREKSRFTYMHNFGEKVDIPYFSWLIRGEGRNILVDAGCSADAYKTQIRGDGRSMLAGEVFQDVVDVKPIEEHFAEQGLSFDDIDTFVQTHLDWDHCMNTPKFRKSQDPDPEGGVGEDPGAPALQDHLRAEDAYERDRRA